MQIWKFPDWLVFRRKQICLLIIKFSRLISYQKQTKLCKRLFSKDTIPESYKFLHSYLQINQIQARVIYFQYLKINVLLGEILKHSRIRSSVLKKLKPVDSTFISYDWNCSFFLPILEIFKIKIESCSRWFYFKWMLLSKSYIRKANCCNYESFQIDWFSEGNKSVFW